MKIKALILSTCAVLVLGCSSLAFADVGEDTKPYISLGQNLTKEQQETVLSYMGIESDDLQNYDVRYTTNAEEYKYLGSYLSEKQIGKRALSSVVIRDNEGDGIDVKTYNINYCTEGMYENALKTAGVDNVDVIVAGPFPISGTAALVGTIKAYENMTDNSISDDIIDSAVNEITTTGEIGDGIGKEQAEEIIADVKEEIASNPDASEEEIKEIILDTADKYGLTLSDENIEKIINLIKKFQNSDIDWGKFSDTISQNAEKGKNIFERFISWVSGIIDSFRN